MTLTIQRRANNKRTAGTNFDIRGPVSRDYGPRREFGAALMFSGTGAHLFACKVSVPTAESEILDR